MHFLRFQIINVPGAPASLCFECQNTLQNFESFREMCFTNDRVFKEMFSQNDHTAVSQTDEVKIDHSESQETVIVDSTIDPQVEKTEITLEYQDIKITHNNTVSSEVNDDNEQYKQLVLKFPENTETSTTYQDVKRKRDDDGKLPCEEKDDAIRKSESSAKDKRKFISKDYLPFKCEVCSKKFNLKHKYHHHIRRHRIEKSHICSYCDKGFISSGELNVHIRSHTLERPFKCKNCDKSFKTTSHLSRHNRIYCKINKSPHQNKKQILECEYCLKTFTVKWRFEAHTRIHTMAETNICCYCSKSFKDSAELKVHVRIHRKEMPFKCNACDKTFCTSSLLTQHDQSYCEVKKHPNDIQEKEERDASFHTTSSLKQHMRSHPGVKPYTCDVCQSNFSTSGNLMRHKRQTKRHSYSCEVCHLKFTSPEHLVRHKKEHLMNEGIH